MTKEVFGQCPEVNCYYMYDYSCFKVGVTCTVDSLVL
jgi:hypothetical protein